MTPQRLLLGTALLSSLTLGALALSSASPAEPATAPAPAVSLEAGTWTVDTTHSTALFKVRHNGVSWFYGRFNGITGTIEYDAEDLGASAVLIKVDTATVDTKTPDLDKHLKSPDFFDVAQFPEMIFESQSVSKGAEKDTFEVSGTLTLHGVTKPLTVPVQVVGMGEGRRGKVAGFHTSFTIDRTEFGMSYGAPGGVGAEVEVTISLETGMK